MDSAEDKKEAALRASSSLLSFSNQTSVCFAAWFVDRGRNNNEWQWSGGD